MFEVLVHRSRFKDFKKGANELISSLPANEDDEFSVVMARGMSGALGFNADAASRKVLNSLLDECYCFNSPDTIYPPRQRRNGGLPNFFFKDSGGAFCEMVMKHESYIVALKKYIVISRHRSIEKPSPSALSLFLPDDKWIERPLYEELLSSCEYFGILQRSGEHGRGAFDLIARDMDGFLNKLKSLVGDEGRLVFIENMRKMPCW
ncbi:hypothetical protein LOY33_14010 [Pseudomonas sp. B21-036]|uniref:hypothetical protein n=1 Tax=Pseudomonas TaxID=286 RepID=UPI0012FDDED4|nr:MULTISPECIES: hypothetical protein [Pseudomonas]MDD1953915.1 hypothetical protein [Pseudomonas sp. 8209]UVL49109.1 hypothetical protein LOY33_14010 [Pseudomonas sp. B21-036]